MPATRSSYRGSRRKARERALQILFQLEATGDPVDVCVEQYWAESPASPQAREFAQRLVDVVAEHMAEIDATLDAASEHWTLERMNPVDRNLLRMAVGELRYIPDVPPKVTLNEAIEIAKNFSTPEGCRFVNGILDRVLSDMTRESKT